MKQTPQYIYGIHTCNAQLKLDPKSINTIYVKKLPHNKSIQNLIDKVEEYDLSRDVLLPKFNIPESFNSKSKSSEEIENEYLKFLTYQGVKSCYETVSKDLDDRILFELDVIKLLFGFNFSFLGVIEVFSQMGLLFIRVCIFRVSTLDNIELRNEALSSNLIFIRGLIILLAVSEYILNCHDYLTLIGSLFSFLLIIIFRLLIKGILAFFEKF